MWCQGAPGGRLEEENRRRPPCCIDWSEPTNESVCLFSCGGQFGSDHGRRATLDTQMSARRERDIVNNYYDYMKGAGLDGRQTIANEIKSTSRCFGVCWPHTRFLQCSLHHWVSAPDRTGYWLREASVFASPIDFWTAFLLWKLFSPSLSFKSFPTCFLYLLWVWQLHGRVTQEGAWERKTIASGNYSQAWAVALSRQPDGEVLSIRLESRLSACSVKVCTVGCANKDQQSLTNVVKEGGDRFSFSSPFFACSRAAQ